MGLSAPERQQIIELQSIYAWGIDQKDGSVFAQAFTEDIETQYGRIGSQRGLDHFTRFMDAFHAPFDSTQHLITNHWLIADGDEVEYRSYVSATLVCKGTPGGDRVRSGGYYVDRVVRTADGWRIRTRTFNNQWRTGNVEILEVGKAAAAHL